MFGLLLAACKPDEAPIVDEPGTCLAERASARPFDPAMAVPGDVAVGRNGDVVLDNTRARFVITAPDQGSTYYHYGGIVADAVPLSDCEPIGEDLLDEVGLILGSVDVANPSASILRAFQATSLTIESDGSDGGPAVVRATGTDAPYWLVEYELVRSGVSSGGRPVSGPWNLTIDVRYTLFPDDSDLRIDWTLSGDEDLSLLTGALLSFAPAFDVAEAGSGRLDFSGISLATGIPAMMATDGATEAAWGVEGGQLATAHISGIDVALDVAQAITDPLEISPGVSATSHMHLSVGHVDDRALPALVAASPERLAGQWPSVDWVDGVVVDSAGAPIAGARVELWSDAGAGSSLTQWVASDAAGMWRHPTLGFADPPWSWEVRAIAPGRDPSELTQATTGMSLSLGPSGGVDVSVEGPDGPLPATIALRRFDGLAIDSAVLGSGHVPAPPGTYEVTVSRGIRYEPTIATILVPEDGAVGHAVTLEPTFDATGWANIDTHVHSEFSPDSRSPRSEVLRHAAAHGLDIVLHTEHEHIVDVSTASADAGTDTWVRSLGGQEVTAPVPEHMTLVGVTPDGTPRGGPVAWYGMDLPNLFAAMRARGDGGLNLFNHPGYMDLVGWDPVAAAPTLTDPGLLGLDPDGAVWSWDFDGIEVMNGVDSPFSDGNGRFEKWMSIVQAGHPVLPIGCSDAHSLGDIGFPSTWFPANGPSPDLSDEAIFDGLRSGNVSISAGALGQIALDGVAPGGVVTTSAASLHITVLAPRAIDVTHAVVFVNCNEALRVDATGLGPTWIDASVDLTFTEDSTVVVAAFGEGALPAGFPAFSATNVPRALVAPVYVDTDGNGQFDPPAGRRCPFPEL